MIAVVDYGAGNLYSLCNSLSYLGVAHRVTAVAREIDAADGVILPGVGAFADAMGKLAGADLIGTLRRAAREKPLLGICLGMQLLFTRGYEFGVTDGLDLIPGDVRPIQIQGLKIPHMGWNDVRVRRENPLTEGLRGGEYFYFVHSFRAVAREGDVSLFTVYGQEIPALVHSGNVYGAQFHPEKSAEAGLRILKNFGGLTGQ